MHRWRRGPVLDVGPEFYGWARAEGIEAGPWPEEESPAPAGASARILLPGQGDEYLIEPGVPDEAQGIPVRVRPPPGARRVEVRTDDGSVLALGAPFAGRIPAVPGRHRVELWLPGGARPLAYAEFAVRGGGQ